MALADAAVGIGDLAFQQKTATGEATATKVALFLLGGQNDKRVTCCRNLGREQMLRC